MDLADPADHGQMAVAVADLSLRARDGGGQPLAVLHRNEPVLVSTPLDTDSLPAPDQAGEPDAAGAADAADDARRLSGPGAGSASGFPRRRARTRADASGHGLHQHAVRS